MSSCQENESTIQSEVSFLFLQPFLPRCDVLTESLFQYMFVILRRSANRVTSAQKEPRTHRQLVSSQRKIVALMLLARVHADAQLVLTFLHEGVRDFLFPV